MSEPVGHSHQRNGHGHVGGARRVMPHEHMRISHSYDRRNEFANASMNIMNMNHNFVPGGSAGGPQQAHHGIGMQPGFSTMSMQATPLPSMYDFGRMGGVDPMALSYHHPPSYPPFAHTVQLAHNGAMSSYGGLLSAVTEPAYSAHTPNMNGGMGLHSSRSVHLRGYPPERE